MSRREREGRTENSSHDPFFDVEKIASATECTGLLAAQVKTEEQGEDLARLQSIHRIKPRFVDGDDED